MNTSIIEKIKSNQKQIMFVSAVIFSTLITGFWAIWGVGQSFFWGWYLESFGQNVLLMIVQYLNYMMIFLALNLIAIRWPKIGAVAYALIGVSFFVFVNITYVGAGFANIIAWLLISVFLVIIGSLYWAGNAQTKKWSYVLAIGFPLLTIIVGMIPNLVKISERYNDNNYEARLLSTNYDEKLIWAPAGPGWPSADQVKMQEVDWDKTMEICTYLDASGETVLNTPQNIRRLPTIQELVGSLTWKGENAGGVWNEQKNYYMYEHIPNKELPLRNWQSKVVFYWSSSKRDDRVYIIGFDGQVILMNPDNASDRIGYRCVTEPENFQGTLSQ